MSWKKIRIKMLKVITVVAVVVFFLSIIELYTEENKALLIAFILSAMWLWIVTLANCVDNKSNKKGSINAGWQHRQSQ